MLEAAIVLGTSGEVLYHHTPKDRSVGYLPEERLWDELLKHHAAGNLAGVAHSHPGYGPPMPSSTDLTTFRNVESVYGLGRPVDWWIMSISDSRVCRVKMFALTEGDHRQKRQGMQVVDYLVTEPQDDLPWRILLLALSTPDQLSMACARLVDSYETAIPARVGPQARLGLLCEGLDRLRGVGIIDLLRMAIRVPAVRPHLYATQSAGIVKYMKYALDCRGDT
jgi:proteasome lid subunit RPN8/RPN11